MLLPGGVLRSVVVAVSLADTARLEGKDDGINVSRGFRLVDTTASLAEVSLTRLPADVRPRVSLRLWTALQIQLMRASRLMALC